MSWMNCENAQTCGHELCLPEFCKEYKPKEWDWDSILRGALNTYGAEAQTLMVMEEMSELQKELCKHARGKANRMEIAEEIADVQIMLDQMTILHHCAYEVGCFREAKLIRLAVLISKNIYGSSLPISSSCPAHDA